MRKIFIALLLVIAMVMVSCKPAEAEVKEPTADDFFTSFYAADACGDLTSNLFKSKGEDGNIDTSIVSTYSMSSVLEDSATLTRYHVTEVTEVTGTVKSEYEAENVVIRFKYCVETKENKSSEYKCNHNEENTKSGVIAFSYKKEQTTKEMSYSNIKLNFNPYKDGNATSLNSEETTYFKSVTLTFGSDDKPVSSVEVDGVKLNDTEWAKVDAVINTGH